MTNILRSVILIVVVHVLYQPLVLSETSNLSRVLPRTLPETDQRKYELATQFYDEVGTYGCMFDVVTFEDVTVFAMDVHVALTEADIPIQVFTKTGSYHGYELDESAWSKVVDTTVTGQGMLQPTPIPPSQFSQLITIKAGITQAFYVTLLDSKDLRYSEAVGYEVDRIFTRNTHMKLFVGAGISEKPFSGSGGILEPRGWNGVIRYNIISKAGASETASSPNSEQPKPDHAEFSEKKELETSLQGSNGSHGATFDIVAVKDLIIHAIEFRTELDQVEIDVEVWTKYGSFLGFENDRSAWTNIAQENVMGQGLSKGTLISSSFVPQVMKAGDTRSFYVIIPTNDLKYTNDIWSTLRSIFVANQDIQFLVGSGIGSYPAFGDVIFQNRIFDGVIHYSIHFEEPPSPFPTTSSPTTTAPVSESPTAFPNVSPTQIPSEAPSESPPSKVKFFVSPAIGGVLALLLICLFTGIRKCKNYTARERQDSHVRTRQQHQNLPTHNGWQ